MKIEVILLTSKFFTVLHPRRDILGAQLGQACTLNIMQIQKTTFRDILTKIFEKLCTLRHERAFARREPVGISRRHPPLKITRSCGFSAKERSKSKEIKAATPPCKHRKVRFKNRNTILTRVSEQTSRAAQLTSSQVER